MSQGVTRGGAAKGAPGGLRWAALAAAMAMAVGLGVAVMAAPAARAQGMGARGAGAPEILRSPQDIAACLCLNQSVQELGARMDGERRGYDADQAELNRLNAQVEAARPRVDSNDIGSVDAFKALLDRRDAAAARFADDSTPRYGAAVTRYNSAVESYNATCGNKSYDTEALEQVRRTLYCPR